MLHKQINILLLHILLPAFAITAFESPGIGAQKTADDPEKLATMAAEANLAVRSIQRQIESLRHKSDAAEIWADPVFSVEYSNVPWNSWSLGDSPMSGVGFKLQQRITLPGKNKRRSDVVYAEFEVAKWQLKEKKNQLRATVKRAYWNLALVRQLSIINERHIDLVKQLISVVRVKYQVGKVGQHDLISLQVLEKKLQDDLGDFDEKEKQLTAAINAAMHRNVSTIINTPKSIDAIELRYSTPRLLQVAKKNRPLLMQVKAKSAWQRLAAERAEYERWPDITVWAGYRIRTSAGADPGTDFFSMGIALPLPLDYTDRAGAQQAEHMASARAAEESYEDIVDQIQAELESSLAAWARASEKASHYRKDIIPAADRTLKAMLVAYQSDRADFASLYQAELQLLNFERASKIAHVRTHVEQISVEATIGTRTSL